MQYHRGVRSVDWEFIASSAAGGSQSPVLIVACRPVRPRRQEIFAGVGRRYRCSGNRVIAQASLLSRQMEVDASARKRGRCGEDTCMQPIRSRSEERTLTPTPSTAPRRHLRLNPVCTRLAGAARPNLFGAVRPSTMSAFVVASAKRMNFNLAQNTLGCVFTHTAKHTNVISNPACRCSL